MKKAIILTVTEAKEFLASFYAEWFADDKKFARDMILEGVGKNVPNLAEIDARTLAQHLHDTLLTHEDWCRQRNLVADEIYLQSFVAGRHGLNRHLYQVYPVEHGKIVKHFEGLVE